MSTFNEIEMTTPYGDIDNVLELNIDLNSDAYVLQDVINLPSTYTFSIWYQTEIDSQITFNVLGESETVDSTTSWNKYVKTVTVNSLDETSIYIMPSVSVNSYFYEGYLVEGITDTSWLPSPEDIDSSVSSARTIAQQTADKFTWLVEGNSSSTEVIFTENAIEAFTKQYTITAPDGTTTIIEGGKINTNSIVGDNGEINFASGTFNYGDGKLSWDGTTFKIANWNIDDTAFYKGDSIFATYGIGNMYFGDDGLSISDVFIVEPDGKTTVSNIIATGGIIGGCVIYDGVLQVKNANIAEKLTANKIDVTDLFSQNITATNLHITGDSTFDGVLNGATGTFSGELNAATGTFSGRVLITNYSSYRPALYFYNNKSTGYNLDGLTITSYIEDNGSDTLHISPPNPPNGFVFVFGNLETEKTINAFGRITSGECLKANNGIMAYGASSICGFNISLSDQYGVSCDRLSAAGDWVKNIWRSDADGNNYFYGHSTGDLALSGGTMTGNIQFPDGLGIYNSTNGSWLVRMNDATNHSNLASFGASGQKTSIYGSGNIWKNGSASTYFATTSSSDRRLKDEVYADMSPYEDFFMRLSPVAFKYHDGLYNAEKHVPLIQWGFYAQDTIEAFNESGLDWTTHELVVVEDGELSSEELKYVNEDDMLKMNYQNMTALNTYMIQKNHIEIAQLKEQIEILTLRLNQLQASA